MRGSSMNKLDNSKYKNFSFDREFPTTKIKWFVNALKLHNGIMHVAMCEHTNKVAFMDTNLLKTIAVTEESIIDDECQDSNFCLCLDCEFNHNNVKNFTKATKAKPGEITPKGFKIIVKHAQNISKLINDEYKDIDYSSNTIYQTPHYQKNKSQGAKQ